MWRHFTIAFKLVLVFTLLFGIIYPLVITGAAQILFPKQANGSLIKQSGKVIGSELIGQRFTRPEYFHPRPSAAGKGYDAAASGGSNLGPTSKLLRDRVRGDVKRIRIENPNLKGSVPVDMVTTSASGLDPDITPANAYAQIARVANARGMSESNLRRIVDKHIIDRQIGILGERRVNVLALNLSLDRLGKTSSK